MNSVVSARNLHLGVTRTSPAPTLLLALTAAMAACDAAELDAPHRERPAGGKADDLDANAACPNVIDRSRGVDGGPVDLAALHDPIAQFVLRAKGECPKGWNALAARLAEHDTADCPEGAGMRTMIVSESAHAFGTEAEMRTVSLRTCGGRADHGMAFSLTGGTLDGTKLPQDVEILAFDDTLGMFVFYTLQGGQWSFHGTSKDVVAEGSKSLCAQCHTDGGMVMKELENPWLHWEGNATIAGGKELVDRFDDLGEHATASDLEQVVRTGNRAWDEIWVKDLLLAGNLRQVLQPLFCAREFNIGTASKAAGTGVRFVPALALVDDAFDGGAFPLQVNVSTAAYEAAIADANQHFEHRGMTLRDANGKVIADAPFGLPFVHRARSDQQFVERLEQIGVIDRDFVFDVLAIDFTRPVFSPERCALLDRVPDVGALTVSVPDGKAAVAARFADVIGDCCTPHAGSGCSGDTVEACVCAQDGFCCEQEWDQLCVAAVGDRGCAACPGREELFATPLVEIPPDLSKRIREGFIASLTAAAPAEGTAEAQLLANLSTPDDSGAHAQRVSEFFAACNARPEPERIADVLHAISAVRNGARELPLSEFDATLPFDDLSASPATFLDPTTCTLVRP